MVETWKCLCFFRYGRTLPYWLIVTKRFKDSGDASGESIFILFAGFSENRLSKVPADHNEIQTFLPFTV